MRRYALRRDVQQLQHDAVVLVLLAIVLGVLGHPRAMTLTTTALMVSSLVVAWRSYSRSQRIRDAWRQKLSQSNPVEAGAPFRGNWKALNCGENPAKNHHLAARDQWFAVDFVRVDASSEGSEILSPVNGFVVHLEDGHAEGITQNRRSHAKFQNPAGNYISIQVLDQAGECSGIYILLAHVKKGSLQVSAGQKLQTGELVGRCGNSGNSTIPHLHIHAQDEPRLAVNRGHGIPIRFRGVESGDWIAPGTIIEA